MPILFPHNIAKLFVTDTFICATHALQLMKYQMEKHGWTQPEWEEYYRIYTSHLNQIGVVNDQQDDTVKEKENGKCNHPAVAKEYMSQPYGTCIVCGQTVFGL